MGVTEVDVNGVGKGGNYQSSHIICDKDFKGIQLKIDPPPLFTVFSST